MAKRVCLSEISDVHDFNKLVQSLPRELFDEIRDLTFAPDFEAARHIDKNYKPPSILQVDTASRLTLEPAFYGHTLFTVPNDLAKGYKSILSRWLKSLYKSRQQRHLQHTEVRILTDLKITNYRPTDIQPDPALKLMKVMGQDRTELQAVIAPAYPILSEACSACWQSTSASSFKLLCHTDERGKVVADWAFKFRVYKDVQAELDWAV